MSQSIHRATDIIDHIASNPATIVELAAAFDVHRSTMFRTLKALVDAGYLRRDKDGTYVIGHKIVYLAQRALDKLDLRKVAHEHISQLHGEVGNTVHLAALMDSSIIYVDKREEASGVRMYSRIGKAVLPYCSGVGKVILANLDQRRRDAILENVKWEQFTARTLHNRELLEGELKEIGPQGWGVDDGEFEDFVNCVAVPIIGSSGVLGAISVTSLRMVENLEQLHRHIPLMQRAAARITMNVG